MGGMAGAGREGLSRKVPEGYGGYPLDIDTILFTHLHNDHAANTTMFKNARLIFQKDEWKTLLDPLPVMNIRRDYDPNLIAELKYHGLPEGGGGLYLDRGYPRF